MDLGVTADPIDLAGERLGILFDRRERIVVHREGVIDIEPVDGDGRLLWSHGEVITDRDGGGVRLEERRDHVPHLGHQTGVAGVIEGRGLVVAGGVRFCIRDEKARGHARRADLVGCVDPVGVVGPVHRRERVTHLDGPAEVHPDSLVSVCVFDISSELGCRDDCCLRICVDVGDVIGMAVGQQDEIRTRDFVGRQGGFCIVEKRVDQQSCLRNDDAPGRVTVPGELHSHSRIPASCT